MQITVTKPRGSEYLQTCSELAKALSADMPFRRIQIVDDTQFDTDVLAGRLRKILGRGIEANIARNLNMVHDQWVNGRPGPHGNSDRVFAGAQAHGLCRANRGRLWPIDCCVIGAPS